MSDSIYEWLNSGTFRRVEIMAHTKGIHIELHEDHECIISHETSYCKAEKAFEEAVKFYPNAKHRHYVQVVEDEEKRMERLEDQLRISKFRRDEAAKHVGEDDV